MANLNRLRMGRGNHGRNYLRWLIRFHYPALRPLLGEAEARVSESKAAHPTPIKANGSKEEVSHWKLTEGVFLSATVQYLVTAQMS